LSLYLCRTSLPGPSAGFWGSGGFLTSGSGRGCFWGSVIRGSRAGLGKSEGLRSAGGVIFLSRSAAGGRVRFLVVLSLNGLESQA